MLVCPSSGYKETIGFYVPLRPTHAFRKHSGQNEHLTEEQGETFSVTCLLGLLRLCCAS